MSTIKDSQLIQLIAMVGLSSFVERAQEAVERIQSVALDKRREHREALTLARGEGGKSERAAAALVAKQKAKELKVALGLCLRAKEEVNECIRKIGGEDATDVEERSRCQEDCLRRLDALCGPPPERTDNAEIPEGRAGVGGAEVRESSILDSIAESLSATQRSLSFQRNLLSSQEAASSSAAGGYSLDNFAYGTTPLASWSTVFAHRVVQDKVRDCLERDEIYSVWGSSTGWLAFYGHLTYGLRTVGCELLTYLVKVAREVACDHGVTGDGLRFEARDMLETDLGRTGILFLTSQCWDGSLKRKAYAKIARELPRDAIVIDYSADLSDYLGDPVHRCTAPVSWNDKQEFCVFVQRH